MSLRPAKNRPHLVAVPDRRDADAGNDEGWVGGSVSNPPASRPGGRRVPSDEEVIAAVQSGENSVAGEIYDRLVPTVDRTLFRIFGRQENDHDDLVQLAFEQIIVTLSKGSFAGACSLKTWAASVTSHVGLNALRSRIRERKYIDATDELAEDDFHGPASSDTEKQSSVRAELNRLHEHLAQMKPAHAETVFLHEALGHDLAEIAVITGVSVSAAQSRLVRGRRELHKRVKNDVYLSARLVSKRGSHSDD